MSDVFDVIITNDDSNKKYWKEIWNFRDLFYILSWRDIKVRYKQTVIGVAWSLIRPLLTMFVFTVVFGKIAHLSKSNSAPYSIVVFAGLLPWQFFSNALTESSNSIISNSNLITKVYFPRLIVPLSSIITTLIDFFISFFILFLLMGYYKYTPTWNIIFLPLFIFFNIIVAFGVGLFLAALNVKYRDFRYIVPFIVQFGLYISPVGFSSNIVPEKWRLIYYINPIVGVIDGFRWCLLDNISSKIYLPGFFISIFVTLLITGLSISYFRKTEKSFADNI